MNNCMGFGIAPSDGNDAGDIAYKRDLLIIGVCGGTGSGKTGVCKRLVSVLPRTVRSQILSMDCFYKPLTEQQQQDALASKYDFDHPNALDIDYFERCVKGIKARQTIAIKDYDFVTHKLTADVKHIYIGAQLDVLFVEGIHIFQRPQLFDIKIFVDVDDDERLIRRILRDTKTRGRTLQQVIDEWQRFVKPNFDTIISSTKRFADLIVPHGAHNEISIDMIKDHLKKRIGFEEISPMIRKTSI